MTNQLKKILNSFRELFSEPKNKNKRIAIFTALVSIITLYSVFEYMGLSKNTYGNFYWLLWPSTAFQPPEYIEKIFQIQPLFDKSISSGWDGQFYYYISNDLLGNNLKFTTSIDSLSYRYQRIGLPLLSKIASIFFLQSYVSPQIYFYTNFSIYCLGIFCLAKLFSDLNIPLYWSLGWLTNVGVQSALLHGLPDAAADSLFIIAFYFLLKKDYWKYCLFAAITVLTREGYLVLFFGFGFFQFLDVLQSKSKRYSLLSFLIPGIIFITWYFYTRHQFGAFPFEQAHGVTSPFLTGFLKQYSKVILENNELEILYLRVYIITISASLILSILAGFKNKLYFAFTPYTILVGSFGVTVLGYFRDYMKGSSILFLFIPILIYQIFNANTMNRFIKIFTVFIWLILIIINLFFAQTAYGRFPVIPSKFMFIEKNRGQGTPLTDFSNSMEILERKRNPYSQLPFENYFLKKNHEVIRLKIKNTSKEIWYANGDKEGRYATKISYHLINKESNQFIEEGFRSKIPRDILPGEEVEVEMLVLFSKDEKSYIKISLLQEGVAWFYQKGGYAIDLR